MSAQIKAVANLLREARSIAVLTGSGVSAESGIPTFRDALTGLWANFRPEELATVEAFRRNPELVWRWYEWRRAKVREAQPNPAHRSLAALQERFAQFTLITQNVDGLHQRAGSREVLELHGNIMRNKCIAENTVQEDLQDGGYPPRCPACGADVRPDVVWFGENLPEESLRHAVEAASDCDVFLSIGTSAVVYPAAELPYAAREQGAEVVEINLEPTPLSASAQHCLYGKAGEILPLLLTAAFAR
jgi:NAD-dependent deacetylase